MGEQWLSRTVHETGQPGRVRLIGDAVAAMICHLPRYMASFDRSTRSPSVRPTGPRRHPRLSPGELLCVAVSPNLAAASISLKDLQTAGINTAVSCTETDLAAEPGGHAHPPGAGGGTARRGQDPADGGSDPGPLGSYGEGTAENLPRRLSPDSWATDRPGLALLRRQCES